MAEHMAYHHIHRGDCVRLDRRGFFIARNYQHEDGLVRSLRPVSSSGCGIRSMAVV